MQDAQSAASAEAYCFLVDLVRLIPDSDGDRPGRGAVAALGSPAATMTSAECLPSLIAELTVDAGGWSSSPPATHSPRG